MKIAIVGASGFIGKACCDYLSQFHAVVPISRQQVDLTTQDANEKLTKYISDCDVAIMLSALTPKKGLTTLQMEQRFIDNLNMAHAFNKATLDSDIPYLIYLSSDSVYSDGVEDVTEDSPTEPSSLYGLAHKVRERLMLEMQLERRVCIIRPCGVFGHTDPHNAYGPNRFVREAFSSKKITLFGEGEELRNHMMVEDLAKVILCCISKNLKGIYNVSPESYLSFSTLAKLVSSIMPYDIEIATAPRVMPIYHKRHDTSKLRAAIGNFEFAPLETGLKLMYKDLFSKANTIKEF